MSDTEIHPTPWSALVVDDDPGIRQSLRLCLEAAGGRVLGVGTAVAALDALDRAAYDIALVDLWLGTPETGMSLVSKILARRPGIGIIVITAFATFESAVEAIKRGGADYLPKPFTPDQVRFAVRRTLEVRHLAHRVVELEYKLAGADVCPSFESRSPPMLSFLETARRAAESSAVVLLRGESGTGKNVFAQWICAQSARSQRPFVSVHCPTLASTLMPSALFGHRPGAFADAIEDVPGKLQEAEGGTLFLDVVADLNADAQARLLRFVNDHTYERLGEPRERRADVRIIATTNKPIEELVRAGRFREDLLFRLNVLALTVPALRSRNEDIPALAFHFLRFFERAQARAGLTFSDASLAAMQDHSWPGNLRELRNLVERAVIFSTATILEPDDLGLSNAVARSANVQIGGAVSLEQLEREHIARVVAKAPTLEAAARTLGIDATTLSRKRKRYGLT